MTATATRRRSVTLDALRAWAIAIMFLDHVLVLVIRLGGPELLEVPRYTVTRIAMPVFLGVTGWLYAVQGPTSWPRVARIGAAGFALSCVNPGLLAPIDILLACAITSPLFRVARRAPTITLTVVLISWQLGGQALTADGSYGWPLLLAHFCVGVLYAQRLPHASGEPRLSSARLARVLDSTPPWLLQLGRRPLAFYVGHVLVLDVVYVFLR